MEDGRNKERLVLLYHLFVSRKAVIPEYKTSANINHDGNRRTTIMYSISRFFNRWRKKDSKEEERKLSPHFHLQDKRRYSISTGVM